MRHFFVINPRSFVTKTDLKSFLLSVENCFSVGRRAEYRTYISRYPRDALSAVHRYVAGVPCEEPVRIYAVGGDGIAFDCLNGLIEFPNAELACIPYGSANDFVRSFGVENMGLFRDIKLMSTSPCVAADAIKCGTTYAVANCSVGIEAMALMNMKSVNEAINKFATTRGYFGLMCKLGAVTELLLNGAEGMEYTISADGEDASGEYILINIGNIAHNGGVNTPNPLAVANDGYLDVVLMKPRPVLKSLSLMPDYTKGKFAKHPKEFSHIRCKRFHCRSKKLMPVLLDGEEFHRKDLNMEVMPGAVKIVSPNGIGFIDYSCVGGCGANENKES
jgi:diacylglycerol kinase family enzyme